MSLKNIRTLRNGVLKKHIALLLFGIILSGALLGCTGGQTAEAQGQPDPDCEQIVSDEPVAVEPDEGFIIEVEDVEGIKHTLTERDIYYLFFEAINRSSALVHVWEHPSEIPPHHLINFFHAQTRWTYAVFEDVYIPQGLLEPYLGLFFDVSPERMREAAQYRADQQAYVLQHFLFRSPPSTIVGASAQSNILTIYYEIHTYISGQSGEFTRQLYQTGNLRILIEGGFPHLFQYLSNEIIYRLE